ncbi:MAG TPA: hypothetical protein VMR25_02760 [Planctomycetaceae bacterium]|nr:hypothetical protein [Planctomycetaceae bacterium]
MDEQQQRRLRLGFLIELVARAPVKLGRTALMKLAYFLQTAKGVPLGYHFRLYTHGPFDCDLLSDLEQACSIGAVSSEMITFASGYGYEFTPGPKHELLQKVAAKELAVHREAIQWALENYAERSAADLELLSTIVYADREASHARQRMTFEELGRKVKQVKPRFSDATILRNINELARDGLLLVSSAGE